MNPRPLGYEPEAAHYGSAVRLGRRAAYPLLGGPVGSEVGAPVGCDVGAPVGCEVGSPVGCEVGAPLPGVAEAPGCVTDAQKLATLAAPPAAFSRLRNATAFWAAVPCCVAFE